MSFLSNVGSKLTLGLFDNAKQADTKPVQGEQAKSDSIRDSYVNQRTNGVTAPPVSRATVGNAVTYSPQQMGPAAQTAAPAPIQTAHAGPVTVAHAPDAYASAVQPTAGAQAAQVAATPLAQAQHIGPAAMQSNVQLAQTPQIAPVANATAATLAPAAQAQTAQINTAQSNQVRQNQLDYVKMLQGAANGQVPSAAAVQLQQQTEANQAQQFGLAAQGAQGGNMALALRTAMTNSANLNQQAAGNAALLRAQETATARGQLGGALDSTRSQDLSVAGQQAQIASTTGLANAGATNAFASQQAAMQQQAGLTNAGAANQRSIDQAGLTQQTNLAQGQLDQAATAGNAAAINAVAQRNAELGTGVSQGNAGLSAQQAALQAQLNTGVSQGNASIAANAASQNAALGTDVSKFNSAQDQGVDTHQADLNQQGNLYNAGADNNTSALLAQLGTQVGLSNTGATNTQALTGAQLAAKAQSEGAAAGNAVNAQQATIDQGAYTQQANLGLQYQQLQDNNILNAQGLANNAAAGLTSATGANADRVEKKDSAIVGAAGTAGAAALSDKRAKKDLAGDSSNVADFLNSIKPTSYKYKGSDRDEHGIVAQDLERSSMGSAMVSEGADGLKRVDVPRATMAFLSAVGELNKRLKKVEGRA